MNATMNIRDWLLEAINAMEQDEDILQCIEDLKAYDANPQEFSVSQEFIEALEE